MNAAVKPSIRQLEASDPASNVWVSANAGSGKTHVLVDRVIRLMLNGTEPSRIMCLTFTKAAAAEMAHRLFERLSGWIVLSDDELSALLTNLGSPRPDAALLERARQLFTRALETPGGLKIQTIHAFCERILQLFPVEAGVVPHFTMLDDRQSAELLRDARNAVLASAKSDDASPLGMALSDVVNRVQADAFDALLTQILATRAELRGVLDPGGGLNAAAGLLRRHLALADDVTAQSLRTGLALDREAYARFAEALDGGNAKEIERAAVLRGVCGRGEACLLELKGFYLTDKGEPRKRDIANKPVRTRNPWLDEFIAAEQARLTEALGRLADLECLAATLSVLQLGSAIVEAFEHAKRRGGCYDFDDLIIRTAELLRETPDAAWVLYKLDGGIEHLLVDEAQDTSPAQWQIVRSLTEEFFAGQGRHGTKNRTVFVVGDRKQSIYSFQGADPDVFEEVHGEFKRQAQAAGHDFRDVDFTVSYRSAPPVLKAVDAVFGKGMATRAGLDGASFKDWSHEATRRDAQGTVEIWPLVKPIDPDESDPWQAPVDREPAHSPRRRLARQLARTIKSWIGRRMLPSLGRPVHPGDILILVRRRNSFFDAMIRALWNEQVPVAGADRLKLGENIAVLDLMALAQFAIVPEDDHALACILKSPLFAEPLSEDQLLELAAGRTGSLWHALLGRADQPFAAMAAMLGPLVLQAPAARPFEFLSGVLGKSRIRFVSRLGSEANDAIDALLDRALDYEETNGTSLAGFVNWFAAGEIEIRRNMEQGAGEVRVMTVHGAKGLESHIVILPDTTSVPERGGDPLLMLEAAGANAKVPLWAIPKLKASPRIQALKDGRKLAETHEYSRLLYVAMTRARDELYVCGYVGKRAEAEGCWYKSVCGALSGAGTPLGEDGLRFGDAPRFLPEAAGAAGLAPSLLPEWAAAPAGLPAESQPVPAPRDRRKASTVSRGIFIHRLLQQLADVPENERDAFIAAAVQRAGAYPGLAADLAALVSDPVFAELFAAQGLSEVPLIAEVPGLPPQRRRIDRLVMKDGSILVADYKTDREVPADIAACNPEYIAQMAAYRDALRKIHPGAGLRLCLVWTEAPKLMFIPDEAMDPHG